MVQPRSTSSRLARARSRRDIIPVGRIPAFRLVLPSVDFRLLIQSSHVIKPTFWKFSTLVERTRWYRYSAAEIEWFVELLGCWTSSNAGAKNTRAIIMLEHATELVTAEFREKPPLLSLHPGKVIVRGIRGLFEETTAAV